ncbi:MAG TPA: RHS repeat-associated core domain-containing protein, partial [Actinomycetota bacterium]|nr:RHS repeat-associated core domain-containing protein [Actinomycetota bacterium]
MKRFLQTIAISLGMMAAQGPAHAADLVVDNSDSGFSVVGDWPVSTVVAGYQGANYQTHMANGPVPGALTVDNQDTGFSVTGDWPVSTAAAGYLGANYRTHIANGPRPGSLVIDNTSGTALGTWSASTAVAGYQGGNYQTHAAGNGTDSFTWPLAGNGHYRVYARWTSHANRAGNARYTVRHTGGDTPVSVSQQQNGGSWQLLGTFELDANSQIVLTDDANGYVIADAVMAEPVNAQPSTASWELPITTAGSYRLYARWSAHPNRATQARYTISHTGGATPVSLNQQQNGGAWQLLGTYALAPGQARVALTDEADGYVAADAVMAVPDTAPAANRATWTPTLAQAGHYDVYARWTAHPNRATQARYTVRHVGGETAVVVNQQQGGGQWQLLGRFDLAPGQGAITLTDEADGYVVADAVRLTSVGPVQASLYFIHPDHLGTPRLVTDAANQVVWRHLPTTDPFGTTPPEEDPQGTGQRFEMPLAFPGQYRDNESGLSYNYFRDYDPGTGRYPQSDPIGL